MPFPPRGDRRPCPPTGHVLASHLGLLVKVAALGSRLGATADNLVCHTDVPTQGQPGQRVGRCLSYSHLADMRIRIATLG